LTSGDVDLFTDVM